VPSRILIADDHSLLRNALKALLEEHSDWQVCAEAKTGLEAVQKAAEFKPDVIILDFAMPVMDGLRAAREIHSASPAVPILMYTNYFFSALAIAATIAGVHQVIDKGAGAGQLLTAVETVLGEKSSAPAAD
jgi:DNA-binding NarL/FixJ family response regulator